MCVGKKICALQYYFKLFCPQFCKSSFVHDPSMTYAKTFMFYFMLIVVLIWKLHALNLHKILQSIAEDLGRLISGPHI